MFGNEQNKKWQPTIRDLDKKLAGMLALTLG